MDSMEPESNEVKTNEIKNSDLKGKRVLVVGLGKSGVASALFLKTRGARVSVSDSKSEDQLRAEIPTLLDAGITVETGGHGERTFRNQDLIVVSPGVPVDVPQLAQSRAMGIPVIGEIELAARFLPATLIAITGSNGKTTTTALCGEILAKAGKSVVVGGNIGTPAVTLVAGAKPESWAVLEVSSFQLETVDTFRPRIAVILNVTPDHLDRHHTFQAYAETKGRIFSKQQAADFSVIHADDATCELLARKSLGRVVWFSRSQQMAYGAFVRDGQIVFREHDAERPIMPVSEIGLKGAHNLENVLAAVCVGVLSGCADADIRAAVGQFHAVEHRLEFVAEIGGVSYFNDSKATNVDATIKALESFPANILLILGGKDKGSDYSVLQPLLRQRVKRVYTIGGAAEKIEGQIAGSADVQRAGTLESAVHRAFEVAKPGDVVLLAPACASFDQFNSYEHRGQVFKQTVRELAAGERAS